MRQHSHGIRPSHRRPISVHDGKFGLVIDQPTIRSEAVNVISKQAPITVLDPAVDADDRL